MRAKEIIESFTTITIKNMMTTNENNERQKIYKTNVSIDKTKQNHLEKTLSYIRECAPCSCKEI